MQLEDYFDFLSADDIRIKGHRIGIDHVLEHFLAGYSAEEILAIYPIDLEKIYATITYYLSDRDRLDGYLLRVRQRREQRYQEWKTNPSPLVERLRSVRARQTAAAVQAE